MLRSVGWLVLVVAGSACAGKSLVTEPGDDDSAGVGGAAASGASGGMASGGTASSGGSSGGSMPGSGGIVSTGGSMPGTGGMMPGTGGTMPGTGGMTTVTSGTGGMPVTGGTGDGGTGQSGSAGAAGVCSLPLMSGNCDAIFYMYGFDSMRGHCVKFFYGGCGGNGNRFSTLSECESTCGGSRAGECPEVLPGVDEPCMGGPCYYTGDTRCLCTSPGPGEACSQIDPECPGARAVPQPLPPPPLVSYTCGCAEGVWICNQ